MRPHELYKTFDFALFKQMLDWFRANDKNVYLHTLATLAQARKLRPVYVQKKSIADQYRWIVDTLQLRASDTMGEHLLQAWFMAGHQAMLGAFCDAMGILHDGKGSIHGDLPQVLVDERLDAGIARLLEHHDAKIVELYLHVFNMQRPGGWENLTARLAAMAEVPAA